MSAYFNIFLAGIFHASVLFLVAAGLQLIFGVQWIVNLACGSIYALGAYCGISATLKLPFKSARQIHIADIGVGEAWDTLACT